jgi:DNA-binding NarL/FixJ family response regulator
VFTSTVLIKLRTKANAGFYPSFARLKIYLMMSRSNQTVPFRIMIADDEPHIRSALRTIVESHQDWTVCGEAIDGIKAIEKAEELRPDLILLDVSMPNLDGLSATPQIRERVPDAGILILTLHESLDLARMAAKAGAWGFVTKSLASTDLVPTIEAFQASVSVSPR